jgi:phytoene synthase
MAKQPLVKRMQSSIKKYGRGYYRATFLFPRKIREATWAYYRFVRVPDEIVDSGESIDPTAGLSAWVSAWTAVLHGENEAPDASLITFRQVMQEYKIPTEYSFDFLKSMEQDLTVSRYRTYVDLKQYMYGSAVVVGYTMSHIIGFQDGALPYARALAEAFQMTNFLRDIKEDYNRRGRIYLPVEDMVRYAVTESHIREERVDAAWRALMQFEIARTRALYETGVAGIRYLHPQGRRAVYAAALIYKQILDTIEKNEYDVFTCRAIVSPFQKTVLLLKALCKRNL